MTSYDLIFKVTSVVTADLTNDQIEEMTSEVIDSFNVNASDVTTDIGYISTGSMQISFDDETTETEIINAMTSTLAEVLDTHPQDVTIVSINLETGKVVYEISSETYEDANVMQNQLNTIQRKSLADAAREGGLKF